LQSYSKLWVVNWNLLKTVINQEAVMINSSEALNQESLYTYQSIGTLCDEPNGLTCSFDAARRWGRAKQIVSYPTFEEAAQAAKNSAISAFLVPCAYPQLSSFIMDTELVAKESFLLRIPSLVLVGTDSTPPATTPLLPEVPISFQKSEFVTSNTKSCIRLLEKPSVAIAITNSLCASFYQLNTYKTLRKDILMPFLCFVKADETEFENK